MRSTFLAIPAVLALFVAHARASIVAFDSFEDYAANSQLESGTDGVSGTGQNGGLGFSGAYNVDDAFKSKVTVQALALSRAVGAYNVDGGANVVRYSNPGADTNTLFSRPLPASSSTFYVSFLLRSNNPSDSEDFVQVGFSDAATGEPKASVGIAGSAADVAPSYFMARAGTGGGNQNRSTLAMSADTTYLLVAKMSKTSGSNTFNRVDLIVNPTDPDVEPTTWTVTRSSAANTSTSTGTPSNLIVRTFRIDATDVYDFDRFIIADTYAEAIQAPEPSGLLLIAGALGLLAQRRRRAL